MKKNANKKTALSISGGGAWGAWGGGTIQGLYECMNKDYDIIIGASTGSLLSPLTALKEMDRLKEAYTSVTQKDIFNVNPFTKKGDISLLNAFWRIAIVNTFSSLFKKGNKPTLGESVNLRDTIMKFFTEEDFDKIRENDTEVISTVVNLNTELAEFKSTKDCDYKDFVDWIWASACAPIFMSLVEKDGFEYTDGGIVEHIPIQEAIDKGATEVDVIIHRPEQYSQRRGYKSTNILKMFARVNDIMHKEISKNDVSISKLRALDEDVTINLYYTPYKLSNNSLLFNKKAMNKWWDLGYNGIKEDSCSKETFKLTKDNKLEKLV